MQFGGSVADVSAMEVVKRLPSLPSHCPQLDIAIGEWRVRIRCPNRELHQVLSSYFAPFRARTEPTKVVDVVEMVAPDLGIAMRDWKREPGKAGKKEVFADLADGRLVGKVKTGMQFVVTRDRAVAFGPCTANPNQVINFVNALFLTDRIDKGWQLCHAAAISYGSRGVAIAASSGGGKSTLALQVLRPGTGFVSNDRVLVRRTEDGVRAMQGVPKQPRVNPGTLLGNPTLTHVLPPERAAALQAMEKCALWALEEKYDVDVDTIYGPGTFRLGASLDAFIVLDWSPTHRGPAHFHRVRLDEREDLLRVVMKSPGPFHWTPGMVAAEDPLCIDPSPYRRVFAGMQAVQITGGVDFDKAAALARSLLEGDAEALE